MMVRMTGHGDMGCDDVTGVIDDAHDGANVSADGAAGTTCAGIGVVSGVVARPRPESVSRKRPSTESPIRLRTKANARPRRPQLESGFPPVATPRRGQLQAMEPIIIVIVLAIIIGLVLLYYVRINAYETKTDTANYQAKEDLAMLGRLTTLPELACPRSETVKTYCIDLLKAQAFASTMGDIRNGPANRVYYSPVLGATNITLRWYDLSKPAGQMAQQLTIYSNLRDSTRVRTTTTYFTAFEPVNGTRQFAMLIVERQS